MFIKLRIASQSLFVYTDTVTSFKSKRDAKKKSLSSHDHNWNTLFLGMNAVADVMAEQYNTTKGSILDDASLQVKEGAFHLPSGNPLDCIL